MFLYNFFERFNSILHKFPRIKKLPEASGINPMPRPLPALNLRADFRTVAEGEYYPAV